MLTVPARRLLDFVLPPLCLGCGVVVSETGALCPGCFAGVTFISGPVCDRCGRVLPQAEGGPGGICAACAAAPPPYRRARAALHYDDGSRALVLRFKYADRTEAAPAFARWMQRAGADLLAGADVVVPVPLHRWRLITRRYNQAALLARHLARLGGLAHVPEALVRLRRTRNQGLFGRAGRVRNVRGAFAVRRPEAIAGRAVVLVDDVLTSGATAGECARVLLRAGAASVDVLTLAHVDGAR